MRNELLKQQDFLYLYACTEEEIELCQMEQRALFGNWSSNFLINSSIKRDPSRSPFIKSRIEVWYRSETIENLIKQLKEMPPLTKSFKVSVIKPNKNNHHEQLEFTERRGLERGVGQAVSGKAQLKNPDLVLAVFNTGSEWVFGPIKESESVWHQHQQKPHHYSTALSTRVARAIANVAAPDPGELKMIDPCCGIGTVLIEALSMGMDIVGSDNNPLVMKGVRENLTFFGFPTQVKLMDLKDIQGTYDVAIIDMPYNHCSVISDEEKLAILNHARRFTKKLVIVTVEPIDHSLEQAGFSILDRCKVKKTNFVREVLVAN